MPPMHQVNSSFTPDLRDFTGCRCRMTLDSITSTRLRLVPGMPCRKKEFHTCDRVRPFHVRLIMRPPCGSTGAACRCAASSQGQEGFGVRPLPLLLLILLRLVDQDLAVVREHDTIALERARRRTLEVDAGDVEAAAVAGALELLLVGQPVRRAAEMGAGGREDVEALLVAHDPHAVLFLEALVDDADRELLGKADLERRRRLEEDVREHEA